MLFSDFLARSRAAGRPILMDGGMGTLLQTRGLAAKDPTEGWNLTHADVVTELHRAYFDAGSQIVNTNTFQVNPLRYSDEDLAALIRAALENALCARDGSVRPGEKFVSLDIGPLGRLMRPAGPLSYDEAKACFRRIAELGCAGDVRADLITVETMIDGREAAAALEGIREVTDLPVLVSCTFGKRGRTMMGDSPEKLASVLEPLGASALGANCSFGPEELAPVASAFLAATKLPVLFKPNAGLPTVVTDGTGASAASHYEYGATPADFARTVARVASEGVALVGGCCGTTPEYIARLGEELEKLQED